MNKTAFAAAVAAAFLAQARADERTIDGNEWQDLSRMSLGREETRASFAPFESEQAALAVLPWKSSRQLTLDSDTAWKFKWSKDPDSRPKGFQDPSYDVSGWETIKVPCSWQAYGSNGKGGWGTPLYTNVTYPFAKNPPRVMDEPPKWFTNYDARNPVGSYRRDFVVPADWSGDRVFLKFDGVDSFYYLWVNGKYVGFTKDSRCAAEYDVTAFVKPGRNTVALEVYRYSDGSYLEDQDMFRLSGIFRSSWLVRRPALRIRDFFVRAKPSKEGEYDGDWTMEVENDLAIASGVDIGNKMIKAEVKVSLFDLDGKRVAIKQAGVKNQPYNGIGDIKVFNVSKPRLWSPESPNCYKVVLTLVKDGKELESVSTLFGFRESRIINGRYCLNGQKVKLHGADRHETDPMFGHFCPHERHEEDVRLLKRANCNVVRNSHYPQDDYWYYLCDLNGIALMDEANVETHGMGYGKESSSHDPRFLKATVWRNMNMVERNKNHPAVLFWSHGNESGPGENFKAADDAVHARDLSRPTHYEGDWSASDLDSNMYPAVGTVQWRADNAQSKRPYFICEYAHNMINAMGNLKDYQDAIESSDVVIGGCIWDWVDQGLYKKNDKGQMIIAYGGDFGDAPNDGQFVMNGCILSDRALEPAYWEIKHVYQPVSVTAGDGRAASPLAAAARSENAPQCVTVFNKQFFRGLNVYDVTETVLVNGKEVSSRRVDLDSVGPRGEKTLPIPAAALAANTPGNSVSVRYSFACREKDGFLEKGYVIADDQIDLANPGRSVDIGRAVCPQTAAPAKPASHSDKNGMRVFSAKGVEVAFDLKAGVLASYKVNGEERLLGPMTLDAYRAPSSNEVRPAEGWSRNGWREFKSAAQSVGKVSSGKDNALEFAMETEFVGAAREELVGYGKAGGSITAKGEVKKLIAPAFNVVQLWRVYPDGTLTCQSEIRPNGVKRELPRIGYRMTMPLDFAKVEWFGCGPFENYRDRKSGAFRGLWSTDLTKFVMPYARPEDANNFEETDAVTLSGPKGAMGFATLGAPVAFAALPYSPKEIIGASHPPELPAISKVEFGIFAETRGLGGASCGPGPLKRDIIYTDRSYRLDFAILPRRAETALSAPPAEFPPQAQARGIGFAKWKVHSFSSEQGGQERAEYAFDGNPDTIWHTKWGADEPDFPHFVACDYGKVLTLTGLAVFPRQDMPNGRVRKYRVELSEDAKKWRTVLEGDLPNNNDLTELSFKSREKGRYMRFTALSSWARGQPWASMAEIQPVLAE